MLAQWMGISIEDKMEQYTVKMYRRMKSIFDNGRCVVLYLGARNRKAL